jgi:hypothetical protein
MEKCFDDRMGHGTLGRWDIGTILWIEMLDLFGLRLFPKGGCHHAGHMYLQACGTPLAGENLRSFFFGAVSS